MSNKGNEEHKKRTHTDDAARCSMNTTKHAEVRQQQRCLPPLIVEWLDRYGARERAGKGAEIVYFDKRSRRTLERDAGKRVVELLAQFLDAYLVLVGETVVTVGHRCKRVRRA